MRQRDPYTVPLWTRCNFFQPVCVKKWLNAVSCLMFFVTNNLESTSSCKNHPSVISHSKWMEKFHKHFYFCITVNKVCQVMSLHDCLNFTCSKSTWKAISYLTQRRHPQTLLSPLAPLIICMYFESSATHCSLTT